MKNLVCATILAVAFAAPAFAQTRDMSPTTATGYLQQAARLEAAEQALPGGGDERVQENLEWRVLVAKANANRVAHQTESAALSAAPGTMN